MKPDINNHLTDEQLDDLILQSLRRQQMVDEINVSVMKQLRRTTRRRSLLRWGRMVAFAFGLPMLLLLFGWLLWSSLCQQDTPQLSLFNCQLPVYTCLLLPVAVMLLATFRAIVIFSPGDV